MNQITATGTSLKWQNIKGKHKVGVLMIMALLLLGFYFLNNYASNIYPTKNYDREENYTVVKKFNLIKEFDY